MFSKSTCVPTVSHQIIIHPCLHYLSQHAVIIAEIVGRFLVNTVVCEVCEDIMDLGYVTGVLVRGKPDQPIFIEEDTKRVDAGYEHIQTQVKLSLIDQVWLGYVPGQYIVLDQMLEASGTNLCTSNGLVYLVPSPYHFDTIPSRLGWRLHNPQALIFFLPFLDIKSVDKNLSIKIISCPSKITFLRRLSSAGRQNVLGRKLNSVSPCFIIIRR